MVQLPQQQLGGGGSGGSGGSGNGNVNSLQSSLMTPLNSNGKSSNGAGGGGFRVAVGHNNNNSSNSSSNSNLNGSHNNNGGVGIGNGGVKNCGSNPAYGASIAMSSASSASSSTSSTSCTRVNIGANSVVNIPSTSTASSVASSTSSSIVGAIQARVNSNLTNASNSSLPFGSQVNPESSSSQNGDGKNRISANSTSVSENKTTKGNFNTGDMNNTDTSTFLGRGSPSPSPPSSTQSSMVSPSQLAQSPSSPSQSSSPAPSQTLTQTPTPSPTQTPAQTPTQTPLQTPTQAPTQSPTQTPGQLTSQQQQERGKLYQLVLSIGQVDKREAALLELSKKRESFNDMAPILWHNFGTIAALLQEIVSIYPLLSPPTLSALSSNRVCNSLALLQCVASHPDTRQHFLNAHIPLFLYPFLNTVSKGRPFEYLRLTSLGVIGALVKIDDTDVINFLLQTEIIPLCLRIMETGSELSKTVATFILQKILLDDLGLNYVCATAERFYAVSTVLSNMVAQIIESPSARLLKHIVRCYLRLSDNSRAREALCQCLPEALKDRSFHQCFKDDQSTKRWLTQLIYATSVSQGSTSGSTSSASASSSSCASSGVLSVGTGIGGASHHTNSANDENNESNNNNTNSALSSLTVSGDSVDGVGNAPK